MTISPIVSQLPLQLPQIQNEQWDNKVVPPTPISVSSHQFRTVGSYPDYAVICKTLTQLKETSKVDLKAALSDKDKTHLLETFGICTQDGIIALDKLKEVISTMSKELEFTPSVNLSDKTELELGLELLKFLQEANDFFLVKAFADVAHVPRETTIAEGSKIVREWLKSPEAQTKTELRLANKSLLFIPQEVFQLKNLEDLRLNGNKLFFLSPDIQNLQLRTLDLSTN
jgi:hypothetical protein